MVKIAEYEKIDDTMLGITIIPGIDSDPNNLAFNWTITEFNEKTIIVKLSFEFPLEVSPINVPSSLSPSIVSR